MKKKLFSEDNDPQNGESEHSTKKQKIIKHTVFIKNPNYKNKFATLTTKEIKQILGPYNQIIDLYNNNRFKIELISQGIAFIQTTDCLTPIRKLVNIKNPESPQELILDDLTNACFCKEISDNIIIFYIGEESYNWDSFVVSNKVIYDIFNNSVIAILPDEAGFDFCKVSKNLMVAANSDQQNNISLYDITNPKQPNIISSFTEHTVRISSICGISHDIFALACDNPTIKLWSIAEPTKPICIATLKGHTDSVKNIIKISDNIIASYSLDTTIKLWNIIEPTKPICTGTIKTLEYLIFNENCTTNIYISFRYFKKISENIIVSISSNGRVAKLWDITKLDNPLIADFEGNDINISPITESIIVISREDNIEYWDIGKYIHNSEHPFISG